MPGHNAICYRQTQPRSLTRRAGGNEWLEQSLNNMIRDAWSIIGNVEAYECTASIGGLRWGQRWFFSVSAHDGQPHPRRGRAVQSVLSIVKKIEQNLLHLWNIDPDHREIRRTDDFEGNASRSQGSPFEIEHALD
jgi:hypothetical protein